MKDPRLDQLAAIMLNHSLQIRKGDAFAITADVSSLPLVKAILKLSRSMGALATVKLTDQEVSRYLLELYDPEDGGTTEAFLKSRADLGIQEFQNLHGEIIIRAYPNTQELAGIAPAVQQLQARMMRPYRDFVINQRKWVLFEYPTPAQAQLAGMAYDEYFDYVLSAATIDYAAMRRHSEALRLLMEKTREVRITGPDTDLRFNIGDIPVIPCCGESNLPDGECFTAPVRDSVEGTITFNTPSMYWGTRFENIKLVFKQGRIINAEAGENTEKLNQILDTDAGARFVGEFSLGYHPLITEPFANTLFDEKISGSFHFTPGACYDEAPNGNESAIHWDLVQIQRAEYGGGAIYFDGQLIRENGLFVPENLHALNGSSHMTDK